MTSNGIWTAIQEIIGSLPCGYEDWSTVWGDPIVSGTVFMVSYAIAGMGALGVARQSEGRERLLWRLGAFILFFQVLNTHLDLHAFVLSYGRCLSRAQGWYEVRQTVQYVVLVSTFVVMATVLLLALIYFRRNILRNLLLLAGLAIVVGITAVKGINYHELEPFYAGDYGYFRGADLIELSGIAIATLAAFFRRRRLGKDREA